MTNNILIDNYAYGIANTPGAEAYGIAIENGSIGNLIQRNSLGYYYLYLNTTDARDGNTCGANYWYNEPLPTKNPSCLQ